MNIPFYKYQGTGNDFIMVDNRSSFFSRDNHTLVERMCSRKYGIGADGLILLQNHPDYDFEMVYYNADGQEGSMCGNGGRCIVQFASDLGIIEEKTRFIAVDGEHTAYIKDGLVHLKMNDVQRNEIEKNEDHYFMNTGSPHYIAFVKELQDYEVFEEGSNIRYNNRFREEGTNVNFVEKMGQDQVAVRTYERGVENETESCGTGVTAAAIASYMEGLENPLRITTSGGELQVKFEYNIDEGFSGIYLIGPAIWVFKGEFPA